MGYRNFFEFLTLEAAAIPEYLSKGVRGPNRDNEKRRHPGALFKRINMDMPIPDEVPGDLKVGGGINRIESVPKQGLTPALYFIPWIPLLTQPPQHSPGASFNG